MLCATFKWWCLREFTLYQYCLTRLYTRRKVLLLINFQKIWVGENPMLLSFFSQFFLFIYLISLWTFRFPDFLLTQKCLSTLSSWLIQCTQQHSTLWISPKTTICFLFHKALSRLSALNFLPFTPHLRTSCQAMTLPSPFHSWRFRLLFSQSGLTQPPVLCSHCLTL